MTKQKTKLKSFSENDRVELFRPGNRKVFNFWREICSMIPDESLDEDWGHQLQYRPHHLLADAGRWAGAESEDFVAIISETIKLGFLIDEDLFGSKVNLSNCSCSKCIRNFVRK
jgi:hypothetical protein